MRLFVAAWPDDVTRRRLEALQRELGRSKGLRFVGPTRWHVTLRFLGEVAEADTPPLVDALVGCAAALEGPVECRLGPGTGWFTGVRVLQLPATGLDDVAAAVRAATVPLVPEAEGGEPPFNGHLTLARSRGRRLSVAALGEMSGIPFEAAFPVPHVDLVASEPSPDGHVYTTVVRAPLGEGSPSSRSPRSPRSPRPWRTPPPAGSRG
jgi:RNA 2',3'-cyclic 3'-phosphodiesterase